MTGGVVPEGADTIVMQEHVKADGNSVTIGGGHEEAEPAPGGRGPERGRSALKRSPRCGRPISA